MSDSKLLQRSVRNLAWIGDVQFELDIRMRLFQSGDWPPRLLERMRAAIVCAEQQAEFLQTIRPELIEAEASVVRRAQNAPTRKSARSGLPTQIYRAATGFEALVAYWHLSGDKGQARYQELLNTKIQAVIEEQLEWARATRKRI